MEVLETFLSRPSSVLKTVLSSVRTCSATLSLALMYPSSEEVNRELKRIQIVLLYVYYESIKREPKIRGIKKCRCDERLQTKTKEFTRLPYTQCCRKRFRKRFRNFFPFLKRRLQWCEKCGEKAQIKKVQRLSHSVCLRSGVGFFCAE